MASRPCRRIYAIRWLPSRFMNLMLKNFICNYKVIFFTKITQSAAIVSYIPYSFPSHSSLPTIILLKTPCTSITWVRMFSIAACKLLKKSLSSSSVGVEQVSMESLMNLEFCLVYLCWLSSILIGTTCVLGYAFLSLLEARKSTLSSYKSISKQPFGVCKMCVYN